MEDPREGSKKLPIKIIRCEGKKIITELLLTCTGCIYNGKDDRLCGDCDDTYKNKKTSW